MEYILDLRFEDLNYNARVHLVTTFVSKDEDEADVFTSEILEGIKRRKVKILSCHHKRIDLSIRDREECHKYYEMCLSKATASIKIEQFILENPDQTKGLYNNLVKKLFEGEQAIAQIGNEYNIPVRVLDKETGIPISEVYYYNIEHLIPKY